jgi:hypothetical protein
MSINKDHAETNIQLYLQICSMKYKELQEKPKQFESLCGHSVDSFDSLSKFFSVEYENYFSHFTFDGKERERPKLQRSDNAFETSSDALFFVLSYVKNNPLQEYHAAQYGLSQPQANTWIHLLLRILQETLGKNKNLPARSNKELKYVLKDVPKVFIDGTERPVQRSTDYQTQKDHFSGKKKALCEK